MALFTPDTHFVVYMDSKSDTSTQEMRRRNSLAPVFDNLINYETTMHFNGHSSVQLHDNRAVASATALRITSHIMRATQPYDRLDSLFRHIR
jgi:hypothetical protein